MQTELRMTYGLAEDRTYYGKVWSQVLPTRGMLLVAEVAGLTFEQLLTTLAAVLRETTDVTRVTLSRAEISGSAKELSSEFIEELRRDPAVVAQALQTPDVTVVVPRQTQLRIGLESLVDAFGDRVFLARTTTEGECPFCGSWGVLRDSSLYCYDCLSTIEVRQHDDQWVSVAVDDLLSSHRPQYWLPRYWNPTRAWIGIDDLRAMYALFVKERNECNLKLDVKSE